MGSLELTAAMPASPGQRLMRLLAAVEAAPSAAESLRACLAGAVEAYGWRAGVLYEIGGQSRWVADPAGDVVASADRERRLLVRWAETAAAHSSDGPLARPAVADALGLNVDAGVGVAVDGEPAYLLQFLGGAGFTLPPDFAETMRRVATVIGLRLDLDRGRQRFADLGNWLAGHCWETDEKHCLSWLSGLKHLDAETVRTKLIGRTRWALARADIDSDESWRNHIADLEARRPIDGFEYESDFSGRRRIWRVAGRPMFDGRGIFRGYRGVADDVSEQRRAEARLAKSEDRFRRFAELTSDWLWEMDENLRYSWVSPKSEQMMGVPAEAHLGRRRDEVARTDIDPGAWRRHLEVLERHEPYRDFVLCRDLPVGRRWIRSTGMPVFDDAGRFKGYIGTGVDVTDLVEADRAAHHARELLLQALDSLDGFFTLWDSDDRLVLANDGFRRLNEAIPGVLNPGITFAEHLRACLDNGLIVEARGREEAWFRWRMECHRNPGKPFEQLRHDGTWMLIHERRTADDGTFVIGTDIREIKHAELALRQAHDELEQRVAERTAELEAANRALRESEERFRDFAAASADWFWELDEDLRFTYLSQNVERIVGVGPAWHYGKTRDEVLGNDKLDTNWRSHLETLRRHEPFRDFVYWREADDKVPARWLLSSGVPRFDADGRFLGYRGVGREVTETLEAQRRLRESEALLRLIADNLPVMIAYVDAEERYLFVNKVVEQWMARSAAELLGRAVKETIGGELYESVADNIHRALAGQLVRYENRVAYPDGMTRDVQVLYVPDLDEARCVRGYIVLVLDVSAERASEERFRQAQKMEAVGQLTGGIAHDFNNLLTVVLGSLELLAIGVDEASEAGTYLGEARQAVERGSQLVQRLLAFARRQALSPRPTDVNALIAGFAPILQRTLGPHVKLGTDLDAALWPAAVDPGQLENVLLNLALNARDASPRGGTIAIATANVRFDNEDAAALDEVSPGPYVLLSVADAGAGMTPEVRSRAMEPFFTTKEVGAGSGLGLSMVFGFVKQSRGHLAIDSELGAGTTVRLYLPRAEPAAAAVAMQDEALS